MFLNAVSVLEVGEGVAAAFAGATLRDLGASVSRLRLGVNSVESMYLQTLARDKRIVDAGALSDVLAAEAFDVIILDRVGASPGDLPTDVEEYLDYVEANNRAVWVTISAFGLSGISSACFGSDLTISASAGVLASVRDGLGRPRALPGRQALLAAGQAAVLAALHGLDINFCNGASVHMDVSAQEAMVATGPVLQCAEKMLHFAVKGGAKRFGSPAGWYECVDGRVYIATHEDHQWEGIKRVIEPPEPIASYRTAAHRIEHSEEIDAFVSAWVLQRRKDDVQSLLQAEGVPATALNSLRDVRASDDFSYRDRWLDTDLEGHRVATMGAPFVVTRSDAPGISGPKRLIELRVAEASHILAASIAGALLGAMGADVVKLEDAKRLDQYRRAGPFIDGREGLEWSGYFAIANHSKRSCLFHNQAELDAVVASSHAVIENWGTSRARRSGVDSATVLKRWPDKFAASSSGFGHEGPLAGYRVYAYNLNAYCGVLSSLRGDSGTMPGLDFAWADFITAYSVATVVAAWVVGGARSGDSVGASIDSSMAEIVVQRLNEALIAEEFGRSAVSGGGNDYLLATDDGSGYVAVTVRSPDERMALASACGLSGDADDDALRAACAGKAATGLARLLVSAGIPAARALDASALIEDPHLEERGFFTVVEHPEWGRRRLIGIPWRVAGSGAILLAPPPTLGSAQDGPDSWRR